MAMYLPLLNHNDLRVVTITQEIGQQMGRKCRFF